MLGAHLALTNILCKIFKRMTNKILVWYLEKKKKIDEGQFNFRKQRSTKDTISKILSRFRRKEKKAGIFLDIKKRRHITKLIERRHLNN